MFNKPMISVLLHFKDIAARMYLQPINIEAHILRGRYIKFIPYKNYLAIYYYAYTEASF